LRAGFTLLELLVAIALLGVLAVLCWRGLESVLSSRDRLTRESEGLRALTIAFAQVDDDLRRTWAVRTIPAVARAVRFLSVDDRLVLELARLGGAASDPTRIDRVVWRLRANTLERGVAANVADGANAAGELVWQPVLVGVRDLQWRAWPSGQGWQTGFAMAAMMTSQDASLAAPPTADPSAPATGRPVEAPILGVELSIERTDGSRFIRVYSVRD
jgi:general secretion pathway protein J